MGQGGKELQQETFPFVFLSSFPLPLPFLIAAFHQSSSSYCHSLKQQLWYCLALLATPGPLSVSLAGRLPLTPALGKLTSVLAQYTSRMDNSPSHPCPQQLQFSLMFIGFCCWIWSPSGFVLQVDVSLLTLN